MWWSPPRVKTHRAPPSSTLLNTRRILVHPAPGLPRRRHRRRRRRLLLRVLGALERWVREPGGTKTLGRELCESTPTAWPPQPQQVRRGRGCRHSPGPTRCYRRDSRPSTARRRGRAPCRVGRVTTGTSGPGTNREFGTTCTGSTNSSGASGTATGGRTTTAGGGWAGVATSMTTSTLATRTTRTTGRCGTTPSPLGVSTSARSGRPQRSPLPCPTPRPAFAASPVALQQLGRLPLLPRGRTRQRPRRRRRRQQRTQPHSGQRSHEQSPHEQQDGTGPPPPALAAVVVVVGQQQAGDSTHRMPADAGREEARLGGAAKSTCPRTTKRQLIWAPSTATETGIDRRGWQERDEKSQLQE